MGVNYRPVCREDRITMAQSMILIKGGEVVNEDGRQMADVFIEDKIIKQVGKNLDVPSEARVIDATGKLVIPGGIDTHTLCHPVQGGVLDRGVQQVERVGRCKGVL